MSNAEVSCGSVFEFWIKSCAWCRCFSGNNPTAINFLPTSSSSVSVSLQLFLSSEKMAGTMLSCPRPQPLPAMARSKSLCLQQSQSLQESRWRFRSFPYKSGSFLFHILVENILIHFKYRRNFELYFAFVYIVIMLLKPSLESDLNCSLPCLV